MELLFSNYIQEGRYLGYIDEVDFCERNAVIQLPSLAKPIIVFSPELTLMDSGKLLWSKDRPQDVGKIEPLYQGILPNSPIRSLAGDYRVLLYFLSYGVKALADDYRKTKAVLFDEATSFNFDGKIEFSPPELEMQQLLPYKRLSVRGQIAISGEDDDYIIDSVVPILLTRDAVIKDKLEVGDWVETGLDQVYFIPLDAYPEYWEY